MENELMIFNNPEFGEIRTIEEDGKVLFCGSDVAKALGYSKPQNAIDRHCKCALKRGIPHPQSPDKTILHLHAGPSAGRWIHRGDCRSPENWEPCSVQGNQRPKNHSCGH